MSVHRLFLTVTLAVLAATALPVSAQRTPRDGDDRARLEERIRARVGEIIRDRLGLDEAEEAELSAITREFEGRRRSLSAEQREAREGVEALLRSETADEREAAALLERIGVLRSREADLYREELERLQDVLTPTQVLQLQELRQELGRRIRAIRSGAGARNDGRPPRGPGDGEPEVGGARPPGGGAPTGDPGRG